MRNILKKLCSIALISACTPVEQAAILALGPNPVQDGGSYSTGGGITVAADLRAMNGQVGLCGVWSESKAQSVLTKGKARDVMHTGAAYLGGEVLHRDLAFMRQVPPMTSYAGQDAHCVRTAMPWTEGAARQPLTIRIPGQVVHREIDDDGGATIIARFKQDGPGAFNPTLKSIILGN